MPTAANMYSIVNQPTASQRSPFIFGVLGAVLGAVVVAVLVIGVAAFGRVSASPVSTVHQGPFTVAYVVLDRPGGDSALGTRTIRAQRIEYFATYVLVTLEDHQTRLWPVDRLRQFDVFPAPEQGGSDSK